jgi:hypothetical protein
MSSVCADLTTHEVHVSHQRGAGLRALLGTCLSLSLRLILIPKLSRALLYFATAPIRLSKCIPFHGGRACLGARAASVRSRMS